MYITYSLLALAILSSNLMTSSNGQELAEDPTTRNTRVSSQQSSTESSTPEHQCPSDADDATKHQPQETTLSAVDRYIASSLSLMKKTYPHINWTMDLLNQFTQELEKAYKEYPELKNKHCKPHEKNGQIYIHFL